VAGQLALSMPWCPAASRSCPSPCLMMPRHSAPSVPAPERSAAIERLPASCAPSGEESSALARRIALASPPAPRGPDQRHQLQQPRLAGPCAGGCGQRVVGSGVSDGRRRLSMLLAAACGGGRGSRESCRGSQRSPGGRPLVCAMCVSPLPMSCAHVRRCLIYLWTSNSYCGRISYVESRCTRCCRSSTNVHPIALLSIL